MGTKPVWVRAGPVMAPFPCQGRKIGTPYSIMFCRLNRNGIGLLTAAVLLAGGLACGWAGPVQQNPALSPEEIIQKAVQRAGSPETRSSQPKYEYLKHNVTEELDTKGRLKERKEKSYQV